MAKKDKKAEEKVTKLEVNPKEESATPETNEVPVADPSKEIVESSIPENFVGGNSNEIDPTTITPIPAFSDEQVTATTSELKDPEFHEKEESAESVVEVNDMQGKPRYHRQDVVHIAQVAFEAFKTYRMVNGYLPVKHWDDESDELKQTFINQIEKALYADLITPAELNKEDLLILAIVNALK
jgi:hypothetical protein